MRQLEIKVLNIIDARCNHEVCRISVCRITDCFEFWIRVVLNGIHIIDLEQRLFQFYKCCCHFLRTSLASTNLRFVITEQLEIWVCGYVFYILNKYYFDILLILLFKILISYRHSINGMSRYIYDNSEEIHVYYIHSSHFFFNPFDSVIHQKYVRGCCCKVLGMKFFILQLMLHL